MGLTNGSIPGDLLKEVFSRTNLVLYGWEITQPCINTWLYVSQSLRLVLNKPQIPVDCISMNWLTAVAPRLGNCVTAVSRTAPDQLSFIRSSSVGFSAAELECLADWLESPQFPIGLHTFLAPPDSTVSAGSPPPAAPPPP